MTTYQQGELFAPAQDAGESRALRDAGIALLDDHAGDWKWQARALLMELVPAGWVGTAEDIRVLILATGLRHPHHPNCWGSLALWAVRGGLLERIGHDHMRDPKSHARETPLYTRAYNRSNRGV